VVGHEANDVADAFAVCGAVAREEAKDGALGLIGQDVDAGGEAFIATCGVDRTACNERV